MPARKPEECDTLLVEAVNRGDLEAALALYEPNASFVQESDQVVTGRAAIREVMQGFLALKPKFT
ncbi:MAG: nuclear transport factor 2 family protein, partial [Deltaproteobacteria bacterium]|nr:nuclear transport factor 2 family protein [Deltaproteobacteria bacterium]